MIIILQMLMLS